ncbi:MAG: hypothetical protein AAFU65_03110 [Pseudomonadota bacterium]
MHLRTALIAGVALLSTLLTAGAAAAPSVDELAAVLWRYNDAAETPLPIPTVEQFEALARGETVHLRERLDAPGSDTAKSKRARVVGFQLVNRPRLLVWLATLHAGTTHEPRLLEHRVSVNNDDSSTWYQHLDTPWPVRNRHWVIRSGKNVAVADQTQDLAWEHRWTLEPRGRDIALNLMIEERFERLEERDYKRTIYLDENAGAWTMFAIEDDVTLVATHTTADMGGWLPERWVAGFVARQLRSVLRDLEAKADRIHEHYDPDDPVHNGRGRPITREQLSDARRRFRLSRERAASAPIDLAPHR